MSPALTLILIWAALVLPCFLLRSSSSRADEAVLTLQLPSKEERQLAEAEIRDVYGDRLFAATTNEKRLQLSRELERQGLDTSNTPSVRFVALQLARTLALEAKDIARAMDLVDAQARGFDLRATEKKAALMAELLSQAPPSERAALLGEGEVLMRQLVDADAFDDAITVGKAAMESARTLRDKEAIDRIRQYGNSLAARRQAFRAAQQALARLKTDTNDAQANSVVGRWYWFVKDNVAQGLAHLARGDDAMLRDAAQQDLAMPTEAKSRLGLAETWQELATNRDPQARAAMIARATYWYEQALPELSGLDKARAAKQLAEMRASVAAAQGSSAGDKNPVSTWKPPGKNSRALFRTFLGVYLYYSDETKPYPVINLRVPNKNLWTQKVQDKVRGRIPFEEISYFGTAKIAVPEDGVYVLEAKDCQIAINGIKTGGSGDINIRQGIHTLTLKVGSHGQPYIVGAAISLRHKETGEEVPFFNTWGDIQRFTATQIASQNVMEVSDWKPTEAGELKLDPKTLRVER